jgi:hypothetical protein
MLLSDAIATGRYLMDAWDPTKFCGCAIAAGLKGAGKEPKHTIWWLAAATEEWPWLGDRYYYPNHTGMKGRNPGYMIVSFLFSMAYNGNGTMEQLIDWVRSVEPPAPEPGARLATTDVATAPQGQEVSR